MRRLILMVIGALAVACSSLAGDEEVTVKVSESGHNNSALAKKCSVKAQKMAVKKYLEKMGNPNITEKVVLDAMASYAKFVVDVEEDEREYEDGELSCAYTITIDQAEIGSWLQGEGIDMNGASIEIVIIEETPDPGQMQLGDDMSSFFFTRYNMFQRRIRDALVKKIGEFGFSVSLLEDNENYADLKKIDPVLVGVSYNVNGDTKGFTATPGFIDTVRNNNPDSLAMYYRIDALVYDPSTGTIRTTIALNAKDLSSGKPVNIGTRDFEVRTSHTKNDMIMADFGTCVESAMMALLNGEDMGGKLTKIFKSLQNAAKRPKGPMKVVINCSQVDKKIKIKFRNTVKKALVSAGITDNTKVVKDTLTCTVKPNPDFGDLDDVWGAISEVLTEFFGDDVEVTDDWAKQNGGTLTITIGK